MPRAGLTTDRVVRAGADLADEAGLDAVTLSAVARGFDVKVASLYSHVAGSADLREGIARLALDELADRASDALAGRSGRDALVAFATTYRDYAREHPGRYAATRIPVPADSPAVDAGRRHAALTRSILRGYDLDATASVHAVRLLGSVFHGFADLELSGSFDHSAPPADESWVAILDALDATLRRWPVSPS
ncbi:TetR family transcriptional regulator [Nocardioides sp. Root1257]|uniref:TetR/AcrR family transcriptional regulator n=1 Tax=unclassified Nocardioides TaxID=2615069 RepID=UPI0006FCA2B7|nr:MULTISPECIES: TetR-like C-terminal domain-containing protein [unclassified Nocardioides]KQW47913.1 TetR family transcriptional regulator [Nocardioides sp. Root1257]KRC45165.1 TetR family transcriptional regulator [Nocardioides sp. Root224]